MLAPGTSVSSTICCLSAQLQRRRRSTVITSARCIVLEVRLSLLLERGRARHRRSRRPHRALTLLWSDLLYQPTASLQIVADESSVPHLSPLKLYSVLRIVVPSGG